MSKRYCNKLVGLWVLAFGGISLLLNRHSIGVYSALQLMFYVPAFMEENDILRLMVVMGNIWIPIAGMSSYFVSAYSDENIIELLHRSKGSMFAHTTVRLLTSYLAVLILQHLCCLTADLLWSHAQVAWSERLLSLTVMTAAGSFQLFLGNLFSLYLRMTYSLMIQLISILVQISLIQLAADATWMIPFSGMAFNLQEMITRQNEWLLWFIINGMGIAIVVILLNRRCRRIEVW